MFSLYYFALFCKRTIKSRLETYLQVTEVFSVKVKPLSCLKILIPTRLNVAMAFRNEQEICFSAMFMDQKFSINRYMDLNKLPDVQSLKAINNSER